MAIENSKNKMVATAPVKKAEEKVALEKYTFPATLEWQAMVIEATSHEDAEVQYLKNRKPQNTGEEILSE